MVFPSGANASADTQPAWALNRCSSLPVFASDRMTVSFESPDATMVPSGENASERTELSPSFRSQASLPVGRTRLSGVSSHMRTIREALPVARRFPSGEKARTLAGPSNLPASLPVAASQSRTVRSPPADARTLPSGEKATDVTGCPCRSRTLPMRAIAPLGNGSPWRSTLAGLLAAGSARTSLRPYPRTNKNPSNSPMVTPRLHENLLSVMAAPW